MKRRVLLVDDEREARRRMAKLLAAHSDNLEVVGEAGDGPTAVSAIVELKPDIVFLDIEMPGLDGFGVLDSLPEADWPIVVFVTAFGHYAIRAFEVHALDYLMKPVTARRLALCVDRIESTSTVAHRKKLDEVRRDGRKIGRLLARTGQKLAVVNVADVIAFESEDRLVFARTSAGKFVLNITMKDLEARVDPEVFCRIHKQVIVQLTYAREVHSLPGGNYVVKLSDGSELPIGRNYARDFRARFG
jgi:two-component system, LytTR family, response regulator